MEFVHQTIMQFPSLLNQLRQDYLGRVVLLPEAVGAVPSRVVHPFHAAGIALYACAVAITLLRGCYCGCLEVGLGERVEFWQPLCGGCDEAGEVAFETQLVVVAVVVGFAGCFEEDFVSVEESVYCDIEMAKWWPLCDATHVSDCFDLGTQSLKVDGLIKCGDVPLKRYKA